MDERPSVTTPPPEHPQPTRTTLRIEVSSTTIWQVIGAVLATLAVLWAANQARSLLAMVAISFFFSLAMEPAVRRLHDRRGWRRGAAVAAIYVAAIGLVILFVFVLVPAVRLVADTVADNAATWVAQLNELTTQRLGLPIDTEALGAGLAEAGDATSGWADQPLGTVLGVATSTLSAIFNLATIALFTFYLSADAPRIKRAVLRRFSPHAQERIAWTWDQAIVQTGGYFYSRSILMGINAFGFIATMVIVGVPVGLAIPLGLFGGFVAAFIPAIGTYLGSAVPIIVTLALQGMVAAAVVLGYALVYQQLENYWLSPRISSGTMSLSGGIAFGAALAGGAIGGPMGAFVALPVAALITSTLSNYARSYEIVEAQGPAADTAPETDLPDGEAEQADAATAGAAPPAAGVPTADEAHPDGTSERRGAPS
jgi:predicted PurR-regulated permease PerM